MRRKELVVKLRVYKNALTPKDFEVLGRDVVEKLPEASGKPSYSGIVRLVFGNDSGERILRRYVAYLHKVMRGCIDPERIRKRQNLEFLKKVLRVMKEQEPEYAQYLSDFIRRAERFNPWMK